ncbi:MAG TPA: MFS transporter [Firmicutes bacterium]|nr:MFS transporter [Bacillota bacterium]
MSIVGLSFVGYGLIGMFSVLFPTIMPTVITGFSLTLAAAGLVYPARAVGALLGAMVGGIVSDRAGRRTLLTGSAALLCLGLTSSAIGQSWPLFLGGFFISGLAQGALAAGINAVAAENAGANSAKVLNRLHGIYSIGAALSPIGVGWLLSTGASWQVVLLVLAGIWLIFTCGASVSHYAKKNTAHQAKRGSLTTLFKHPVFLLAGIIAFTYNGLAWSLIGWVNTYLQQEAGLPQVLATGMLTLFYIALAVGRFACASLTTRFGNTRVLLACALGAALAYPLVLAKPWPILAAVGVLFSGLTLSGLYPIALAVATRFGAGHTGAVVGAMSNAMTLGTMLPPWWTGILAEFGGLQMALSINYIMVIIMIAAVILLNRQVAVHTDPAPRLAAR